MMEDLVRIEGLSGLTIEPIKQTCSFLPVDESSGVLSLNLSLLISDSMRKREKPLQKLQLYRFKGFDMDSFISRYMSEVEAYDERKVKNVNVYTGEEEVEIVHHQARNGARTASIIEKKCLYLQDAIIRRVRGKNPDDDEVSKDLRKQDKNSNSFRLSSEILKSVIGAEYVVMLRVLVDMGYITHIGFFEEGRQTSEYHVNTREWELSEPFYDSKIQMYKEQTVTALKKKVEGYMMDCLNEHFKDERISSDFIKSYYASLNHIQIEDYDGITKFCQREKEKNENAADYYDTVIERLESKERYIDKIDNSHRIYHLLTNLKREIKQYLTIDFSLDCRNSHPIIFNHFIFENHNIPESSSYIISNYIVNEIGPRKDLIEEFLNGKSSQYINYHYLGNNLRKILIDNNIEVQIIARLSNDELEYIYLTSNGLFWDRFLKWHPDRDKDSVKKSVFAAVFYRTDDGDEGEYAKEFGLMYPHVFEMIRDWKRPSNEETVREYLIKHKLPVNVDKMGASLSVAMMAFESDIYIDILRRLYMKRWKAVHIHDCIVIPKYKSKNRPTIDQVRTIMQEEFAKFGLCPSFA